MLLFEDRVVNSLHAHALYYVPVGRSEGKLRHAGAELSATSEIDSCVASGRNGKGYTQSSRAATLSHQR